MKSNLFQIISLLVVCLSLVYCDRPQCTNNNPIFEQNQPDSKIYKEELARKLKEVDQTKLRYWLQKYEEKNGKEYLYFYVQGDGLCAKIMLTMNNWERLEDLRKKKGVTYRGAKFTNLKYEIRQSAGNTEFIYKSYREIID
ncbi:hypothetical protein [Maribellus maritimus]|uniref:hypothetical protein n=1 Tax=Maribellus maritimus TaxID=2870838 RepID=UPI001EEAA87B|nr:hypothetical protein [Maribellus maritimus]MCG6187000.1 hypothetical protein [Maribellus maritimus]